MRVPYVLPLFLLLAACAQDHGAGPGTDAGSDTDASSATDASVDGSALPDGAIECDLLPECFGGDCCEERTTGSLDAACNIICPDGYSAECEPHPAADCATPWWACQVDDDCSLQPAGCCYPCGIPEASDFDGVHDDASSIAVHRELVCAEPEPCSRCATQSLAHLYTSCEPSTGTWGRCVVHDVRDEEPFTGCTKDDDCYLRVAECCECGADLSDSNILAFRRGADVSSLYCPEGSSCPDCIAEYPSYLAAVCDPTGHCAVATLED